MLPLRDKKAIHRHRVDWHRDHNKRANLIYLCARCRSELHKVGSLNLEDLVALRDKVKARAPQRFAKTLWNVACHATSHTRQSVGFSLSVVPDKRS